jgi:MerR family transcriptional regulator, mercuric resistance operon regulatory protein
MINMTIGALARAAAVHVETIRYYQRRGLLHAPKRQSGSVRRYGEAAVKRLRFVRRAQELGFTLEEISTLIQLGETPDCRGARNLAAKKLEIVESRLNDLVRMRAALEVLVKHCDNRSKRSCPIIDSLSQ